MAQFGTVVESRATNPPPSDRIAELKENIRKYQEEYAKIYAGLF